MSLLQMNVPEGFAQAVHLTQAELEGQIRLMAALKMFELGKLSSGKAAELAAMTIVIVQSHAKTQSRKDVLSWHLGVRFLIADNDHCLSVLPSHLP